MSVVLERFDKASKYCHVGYMPSFTLRQAPKPNLKINESHLLLRQPKEMMERTNHVHHFVTNFADLLTTELL